MALENRRLLRFAHPRGPIICWTQSKILTHPKERAQHGKVHDLTSTALANEFIFPNLQDADAEATSRDGSHRSFQLFKQLLQEGELLVESPAILGLESPELES